MSHVFVSYKKEDRRRVQRLVDGLTAEGVAVWWDVHIEGGAAWREEIRAKLEAAACVVVVWSEGSVGPDGHFVQDEAAFANRRGVYLPVAIDAVAPPLGFGQQQVLPLVGWRGNRRDHRFREVLASVLALVGTTGGPATGVDAPARQVRAVGRAWIVAAAAAAIAVLAILAAGWGAPFICSAARVACPVSPFAARAPANTLAVLPFANLSGDPGQDYFSEGLSEEVLSRLAQIPQLQVVGRTSSFTFKGAKADSRAIAAKLGVAYIVDGSVRREGDTVRVTAQLVEAKTGFERWSQTYDRKVQDIFAVQSDIAEAVARALSVQLAAPGKAALELAGTANPEAYDDYLRGRRLFEAGGGEMNQRDALAKFDTAIAADPRFAAAHAARSRTLLLMANQFLPADQLRGAYDDAIASARRAVELNPRLPETQASLAQALKYGTRDFAAAQLAYERALAVGGVGDASVLLGYGQFECEIGNTAAGLKALRRAVTLDPLNPLAYKALGLGSLSARDYPQTISAMRRALELSPGIDGARAAIGEALVLMGRPAEARSEFALEPEDWQRLTGQAIAFQRLGDRAAAQAALAELKADGDANAYQLAQVYSQWGDADAAFGSLNTAFRIGDAGVEMLKTDPLMAPLHHDPRFDQSVARAGNR